MSTEPGHHIPGRPPGFLAHPSNHRIAHPDDLPAIELVGCPACDQPAEITGRVVLESTGGPIEHLRIRCLFRHAFFMPAELLHDLTSA